MNHPLRRTMVNVGARIILDLLRVSRVKRRKQKTPKRIYISWKTMSRSILCKFTREALNSTARTDAASPDHKGVAERHRLTKRKATGMIFELIVDFFLPTTSLGPITNRAGPMTMHRLGFDPPRCLHASVLRWALWAFALVSQQELMSAISPGRIQAGMFCESCNLSPQPDALMLWTANTRSVDLIHSL